MPILLLLIMAAGAWGQANPVGRVWTYAGTPTGGDCTSANYGHVAHDTSGSTVVVYDCGKSGGSAAWIRRDMLTQNGTGAVARTVDSRLKDVIHGQDFGVVCDGTTATTTALQAALDAAAAGSTAGGTVLLSASCTGSYNLGTTGITIPENVTLAGSGRVGTKLRYTGTGAAITMGTSGTARRHHGLRDLSIDLESAGTGAIGISLIRTFYDRIADVDIRFAITAAHQSQVAVKFDGGGDFGSGAVLTNVTASGCMLYGFWYTGTTYLTSYTANAVFGGTAVQSCSVGTGLQTGATITGASAQNPSVITTSAAHGFVVGDFIKVSGVTGSIGAAVNSYWVVSAVTDSTHFTIEGSYGSGLSYTSGGTAQKATTGIYLHNGDQNKYFGTGAENFEVGVGVNRVGNEMFTRLEGNTKDWVVTANAEGTKFDGTFAPSTIIDRGPVTDYRSSSPAQQANSLYNLRVPGGLIVSGAAGTELTQRIGLAPNPTASPDITWTRNYSGNSTITTSSGNASTINIRAGTGQSTTDLLTFMDSSGTIMSRITSTGALSGSAMAASDTASGIVELATAAETTTGTDAARAITPDGLAGSSIFGVKTVQVVVFDWGTATTTGDGKFYYVVPAAFNGMNLVGVHAQARAAGTTGTTDIQIARCVAASSGDVCSSTVTDMLSTKLTIDSGENHSGTAATAAVINTANDDVATNQVLRIDVDAVSTTPAQGLIVSMTFQLP